MKQQRAIGESIILFYSRILWNSTPILDISPEFSDYKHASEKLPVCDAVFSSLKKNNKIFYRVLSKDKINLSFFIPGTY